MRVPTFYCLLVILLMKTAASQDDEISRWISGLRTLLKGCPPITPARNSDQQDFLSVIRYCLQHRAIVAVDTLLMDDDIPILDGINLVRYEDRQSNTTGKEVDRNRTNDVKNEKSQESDKGWQSVVMNRLTRLFRTHVLKIDLDQMSKATGLSLGSFEESNDQEEGEDRENLLLGRRRHQKRKGMIIPILMMGFLFMGTILIPMGFQFLAVLGGKALILAKMALMLSSIQGLKKIATSGVNYGLYHSPTSDSWHERSQQESKPPMDLPYQSYSHRHSSP